MFNAEVAVIKSLSMDLPFPYKFAAILVFAISICAISAFYFGAQTPSAIYLIIAIFGIAVVGFLALAWIIFKVIETDCKKYLCGNDAGEILQSSKVSSVQAKTKISLDKNNPAVKPQKISTRDAGARVEDACPPKGRTVRRKKISDPD